MEHSVAINPVEELKPRATVANPASAEAGSAAAVEAEVAAGAAAVEVVEEAEAAVDVVAAAVDDVASWRFGPPPRVLRNRKLLKGTANKTEN